MLCFSRPYPGLDYTCEWGRVDHYYRYSWWLSVQMVTVNYGHLFLGRRSSVRGLSAGSVYFGSPGWIWEYLFRGAGCHPFSGCSCDDSDVISSFVYFGTPQVGFMVTWFLRLVSDASWSDWLWVSDVCDQSSSRSFDPVPWDAQPDQSCSHHLHHSMFIFKKIIMHEKTEKVNSHTHILYRDHPW